MPVQMQHQLPVHTIDLLDVTHARAHCEREKTEKTQQSTLLYYSDTESTVLNKSEEGRKAAAKKPSSPRRALYAAAAAAAWPPKRRTLPPPLLEWLGNASGERRIASQSESDSIQREQRQLSVEGTADGIWGQQPPRGERESRHYRTHTHACGKANWMREEDEGDE